MPGTGCCGRFCGCLASIPCPSVIAWVFLTVTASAAGGSLLVAAQKIRDLFNISTYLGYADAVCLGVLFGMVFCGLVFLIVSGLSSPPTSAHLFSTSKKNICARVLNTFAIVVMVILQLAWMLVSVVLAVPVMLFTLLHILVRTMGVACINLKNYGFDFLPGDICGDALEKFYHDGMDALLCFIIALVASILLVLSLTFFIICASANAIHLKDSRFSTFSVYKNDLGNSRTSVVDTRM